MRFVGRSVAGRMVLGGALVLGAWAGAFAQSAPRLVDAPEYVLHQWTTADGLPQNSVNAIAQTPDGYLWLGTFGGLVRFDGTSFQLQERADSSGRHIDRVLSLAVAPDSALWIGTESGLFRLYAQHYASVALPDALPDQAIRTLRFDRAGVLWMSTMLGAVARWGGDSVAVVAVADVAPDTVGILRPWGERPRPRGAERLLLEDRAGALWYATASGAAREAGGTVRHFGPREGVPGASVAVEDPERGVWIGTINDGLVHLDPRRDGATGRHYPLPGGAKKYRVLSGFVAADGSVWFGTSADGLLRAQRPIFTTYTQTHGLSHNVATAVLEDASGTMWLATNCWGVNAIEPSGSIRVHKPRRPGDPRGDPCVFALAESPAGTMWMGTYGGGVTRWQDGREERLRDDAGLRDSVVLALFADGAGTVWAGTNSGGVSALSDGKATRTYTTADGLAHNSVRVIQQTRDGALWVGTLGGLTRIAPDGIRSFTAADGLEAEHVRAIHEDRDGILWVGTYGGGIHRLRDSTFVAVTRRHGLADDVVSSILEDDFGQFWMSGNRGIQRVPREALLAVTDGRADRLRAVLYDESDGLRNAETNGGFQPAAWRDHRGHLWYPTVHGVARVDPARVRRETIAPPVTIESVVVDGETRAAAQALTVGPGRRNVEFQYAGLSISAPEHLRYRYRLEGFDDDWVEVGTRRVAYYPRLSPGDYRFVVTAADRDGNWHPVGAAMTLDVLAPVHARPWFIALVATSLVASLMVVARREQLATARRRAADREFSRRLLESQEQERSRIARELHDGLGQELLVVRNRALLALRSTGIDPTAREQITQLSEVVSSSLTGLRELAHNLTPHQLEHLGLSAALRAMVESAAEAADARIDVLIDDVDDVLAHDAQLNVYRVVQEAIANIVRHADARAAGVEVRRGAGALRIVIVDDGQGFAVARDEDGRPTGGFGIAGIAERVRILGGRLSLWSEPGRGTRLEIEVPAA